MATTASDTLELASTELTLLDSLANAAANLAERSRNPDLSQPDRAALRNQAKLANEQAGILLARGTVVLFNGPPSDAAKQIAEAIGKTQETLANIQRVRKAIEFVTSIVGVAVSLLAGDWKGVLKAVDA